MSVANTTDPETTEWRHAVGQSSSHQTRHEAAGAAAIVNGQRNRIAPEHGTRVTVWPVRVCGCKLAQTTLDTARICRRCGGAL